MPDFSVILQDPTLRQVVQENILERAFHDALFPRMLFRAEATPVLWPENIGDSQVFSAPGLIPPDMRPTIPGTDPTPVNYPMEQWAAQLQTYSSTIDTHMPTAIMAIVNLFLRNIHQLGLQSAQTLNRIVRNRLYGAALSGWTVADGAQTAVTSLRVKRLNGFTRARNPALTGASLVRFDMVSAANPLSITVRDNVGPSDLVRNVVGFVPDTAGDEVGPGIIILDAVVTVSDRAFVYSVDRTQITRVGGGNKVDDLTATTDIPTLGDIRVAIGNFWQQSVPEHADGRFHAHFDPVSQTKIFADTEFQRLLTSLPDYYMYKQFAIGELLNTVFMRNNECPVPETVQGGQTATFDQRDPFPGELWNTGASSGTKVHRILFTAQGSVFEYYTDPNKLITEAGLNGVTADVRVTNNSIQIASDRVQLLIRAPMNRLMDQVSTTWKLMADWPMRTDAATGNTSRYKRVACIEHAE
jgi:hypothetical protein